MKVLVLGGTKEAHELCLTLQRRGIVLLHARAGILDSPPLPYPHRDGGFGGADGLARFIREEGFTRLISATHPFAREIAENAKAAAQQTGIPILRFEREDWLRPSGADWRLFERLDDLVRALPPSARCFLTLGHKHLAAFESRSDLWCLWRVIEPAEARLNGRQLVARPPFSLEEEIELMRAHKVDLLVSKQSGGPATYAKIEAAARLGLPVYLWARPAMEFAETAGSVEGALDWLLRPEMGAKR